jgi:hypothetical protein
LKDFPEFLDLWSEQQTRDKTGHPCAVITPVLVDTCDDGSTSSVAQLTRVARCLGTSSGLNAPKARLN